MATMEELNEDNNLALEIYDIIKTIADPERPQTLEDLNVVNENDVKVIVKPYFTIIKVYLTPTIPECSLATLIALCVRIKIEKYFGKEYKIEILLKEGTHSAVDAINKQVNDKERIAAAMENENLRAMVEECISDD